MIFCYLTINIYFTFFNAVISFFMKLKFAFDFYPLHIQIFIFWLKSYYFFRATYRQFLTLINL